MPTKLCQIYDHKYANFLNILHQFYDLKLWQSYDHYDCFSKM